MENQGRKLTPLYFTYVQILSTLYLIGFNLSILHCQYVCNCQLTKNVSHIICKSKGKGHTVTCHEGTEKGTEVQLNLFFNLCAR
jgi:hypothetical protein